jgi:hypothetical protein
VDSFPFPHSSTGRVLYLTLGPLLVPQENWAASYGHDDVLIL